MYHPAWMDQWMNTLSEDPLSTSGGGAEEKKEFGMDLSKNVI